MERTGWCGQHVFFDNNDRLAGTRAAYMALISEFEGIDCRERSVKSGETLRPFIEDPSNVQLEGISKHSQCNGSGSREKSLRASKLGKVRRTVSKDEKNCARYSDLFMQSLIHSLKKGRIISNQFTGLAGRRIAVRVAPGVQSTLLYQLESAPQLQAST